METHRFAEGHGVPRLRLQLTGTPGGLPSPQASTVHTAGGAHRDTGPCCDRAPRRLQQGSELGGDGGSDWPPPKLTSGMSSRAHGERGGEAGQPRALLVALRSSGCLGDPAGWQTSAAEARGQGEGGLGAPLLVCRRPPPRCVLT